MILASGRAAVLLAVLLAGCAQWPVDREAATPPELSGRLALRVDSDPVRQWSANFELSGNPQAGRLNLTSPLGTVMAQARWQPGLAELSTPDGRNRFDSLDDLGEQALGERIPMAALLQWLRGRPWNDAPWQALPEGPGFQQLGWRIDLARLADGAIDARRDSPPVVTVRARLDR